MSDLGTRGISAGEAYMRAIKGNSKAEAVLMRVQSRFLSIVDVLKPVEFPKSIATNCQVSQIWKDALRESAEETGEQDEQLEAFRMSEPTTIEGWERLARKVGISEEYLQGGPCTAAQIYERAIAFAEGIKLKRKLECDAQAEWEKERSLAIQDTPDAADSAGLTSQEESKNIWYERSAIHRLLQVFTNGISDDRINKAAGLVASKDLSTNEKLTKIDKVVPFPPTASGEQLGELFGVSKQAVIKTEWWKQNRKGEKENEVGRRRETHRERAENYEPIQSDNEVD